jgi:hypothetical protein
MWVTRYLCQILYANCLRINVLKFPGLLCNQLPCSIEITKQSYTDGLEVSELYITQQVNEDKIKVLTEIEE